MIQRDITININSLSIVMLGASGAVGTETLNTLRKLSNIDRLTLLGRHPISGIEEPFVQQYRINVGTPDSYEKYMSAHDVAICTLGVGQPSTVSKEDFVRIDKTAVLDFAKSCKLAGVKHFELLSSVGISPESSSFFLRTKGELVTELKALEFERLSIFQPSMILTQTNRYGVLQGITLTVWPLLKPLLIGNLRKYRGVRVSILGQAIANNIFTDAKGYEELQWNDFKRLAH